MALLHLLQLLVLGQQEINDLVDIDVQALQGFFNLLFNGWLVVFYVVVRRPLRSILVPSGAVARADLGLAGGGR